MSNAANLLSARAIAERVAGGRISCREVVEDCIERVAAREAHLGAWSHFDADQVRSQARAIDEMIATQGFAARSLPLLGVPIGIKDVIDTVDMPTGMGSPIYKGYAPAADAACVAGLRSAGAVIFGKTTTCEFAGPAPADTRNPLDPSRTPGGSSSGSAAAVADWMVPAAIGTQTGGSVLRPSSYCGIVGFKPTFGIINTAGVKPAAQSLDTVGIMARSIGDASLVFKALTGARHAEPSHPRRPYKIGIVHPPGWEAARPETCDALAEAASLLAAKGHVIRNLGLPELCNELPITRQLVNDYERVRALGYEWSHHREMLSAQMTQTLARGEQVAFSDYTNAIATIGKCRLAVDEIFEAWDLLLCPAAQGEAELGLADTGDHTFQSIWTQLGLPAVSLPTSIGPSQMPVGIQLVGRRLKDLELLAAGSTIGLELGVAD